MGPLNMKTSEAYVGTPATDPHLTVQAVMDLTGAGKHVIERLVDSAELRGCVVRGSGSRRFRTIPYSEALRLKAAAERARTPTVSTPRPRQHSLRAPRVAMTDRLVGILSEANEINARVLDRLTELNGLVAALIESADVQLAASLVRRPIHLAGDGRPSGKVGQ